MEWLVQERPEYIDRLRRLVERGQVEILGGGFYEPILPMIPPRDRVGQVSTYRTYLETLFGGRVRGAWLAERVWEQNLVTDLTEAGVEYTGADDFHFKQAGLDDGQLTGYHLTEYDGRLLRVFPISERMRYCIPFRDPGRNDRPPGESRPWITWDAVVVFARRWRKAGLRVGDAPALLHQRLLQAKLDLERLRPVPRFCFCTFSELLTRRSPWAGSTCPTAVTAK